MSVSESKPTLKLKLKLYKAALRGDWDTARRLFMDASAPLAFTTRVTDKEETALHIAVGTGHSNMFVKMLLEVLPPNALAFPDKCGSTALHVAAMVGNLEAVELLVLKDHLHLRLMNRHKYLPVHEAAKHGHLDTARYLLVRTEAADPSLLSGEHGVLLLNLLIFADSYGTALKLLGDHPGLATQRDSERRPALELMSTRPQAFYSGYRVGCLTRLMYYCTDIDPQSLQADFTWFRPVQDVYDKKLTHLQALKLVKELCQEIVKRQQDSEEETRRQPEEFEEEQRRHQQREIEQKPRGQQEDFEEQLGLPALNAAKLGIPEVVSEIIKAYPYVIWLTDKENHNIIRLAVEHRQENVYNLLYQINLQRRFATSCTQENPSGNSILHLAAKLNPSSRISGPALQMQRELQWFKEVEKVIEPPLKEKTNDGGETPRQMFSREHQDLVKQGEKWMKDTAQSCSVVAALIATVVFAAAYTVPGGNRDGQGIPFFLKKPSFIIFAAADAVALFFSLIAVFMFLGVLNSRYDEDDFLTSLPKKLIIGLISLLVSITSMVTAFSASLYIVIDHRPKFLSPIILLAVISAASFAWIQFALLVEAVSSTFGRSIFGPQSKEPLYGSKEDDSEAEPPERSLYFDVED